MAGSVPARSDAVEAKPMAGLGGFKSSGVHVLEPYISPPTRSAPAEAPSRSGRPVSSHEATHAPHSTGWQGHIPADNVGFRLLEKAGWSVGTGLGADEQGQRDPIEPVLPKGTHGLGFNPHASHQRQRDRTAPSDGKPGGSAEGRGQAQWRRFRTHDRVAVLAQEELARESPSDKVARHKQIMSVKREHERGRAIECYLRTAFNDPFDHLHSDNSNPLSRPHKLTESNPLLNPIGD